MKRKYNILKDRNEGSGSRQRVIATPERSRGSSQEPATAHGTEISTTSSVISITGQPTIAPIQAAPVVGDSNSFFDKLRGAMDGGDTNLFEPLQISLDELVKMGHSKVSSLDLKYFLL